MPILSKANTNPINYHKILWREAAVILMVLSAQLAGSSVTTFTYVAISVWALRSPKHAIQALCLSWLITFLNPGIFTEFEGGAILRWLVFFAAFSRVVTSKILRNPRISREIICLAPFFLFALLVSMFKSYAPIVSLFKLVMFAMGVVTILFAFELTGVQKAYWRSWFTTFFLLILVSGFPLYFFDLGYVRNGRGFQGLLNHPQAYGVFLASMVAWFTGRILFEKDRSVPVVTGVVLGWFSLFATFSRTGILAAVLGCTLTVIIGAVKRGYWRKILAHTFGSYLSVTGLCVLLIFLVFSWAPLSQATRSVLQKGTEAQSFTESYDLSRGALIERSINNFLDNPWTGIGFGIASDPFSFVVSRDKWLGLPIGASIEKGLLPVAVLEEVGIIGAGFFLMFIFALIRPILNWGSLPALWLFITSLLINMGEMIFFSFGGMGLYIWLMIGFSRVLRE